MVTQKSSHGDSERYLLAHVSQSVSVAKDTNPQNSPFLAKSLHSPCRPENKKKEEENEATYTCIMGGAARIGGRRLPSTSNFLLAPMKIPGIVLTPGKEDSTAVNHNCNNGPNGWNGQAVNTFFKPPNLMPIVTTRVVTTTTDWRPLRRIVVRFNRKNRIQWRPGVWGSLENTRSDLIGNKSRDTRCIFVFTLSTSNILLMHANSPPRRIPFKPAPARPIGNT